MRDTYHEELDNIAGRLVDMTEQVASALSLATVALLTADGELARRVIDSDNEVDETRSEVERRALDLIARQQPVARDLRAIAGSLRIATELERAGDHAVHVARLALRRIPVGTIPDPLQGSLQHMADTAEAIVTAAGQAVSTADATLAARLDADDDVLDDLLRALLALLLTPGWPYGVETALDVAFAGRHYERFADRAVSVARHVAQFVVGDSTHPSTAPTNGEIA